MIVLLRYPFFFRIFNALVMSLTLFLFENIVNREKSLVKNLIISLCFCLYPIWLFGEVGWAATSLTYLWTLFACLVAIRPFVMELYGEKVHPTVGSRHLPLKLILLSPAQKPVQITSDLPGFWNGSWKLVRAEMKSRYPKHEWPEFPADAAPMRRSVKKSR